SDCQRTVLIDAPRTAQRSAAGNRSGFRPEILPARAPKPLRRVFVALCIDMASNDGPPIAGNRSQTIKTTVTDDHRATRFRVVKVWNLKESDPNDDRGVVRHGSRNHVDHAGWKKTDFSAGRCGAKKT